MKAPVIRRCGAGLLGVLLVLGPLSMQAHAQIAGVLGQAGLNAAAYQHPFAALAGYRFGTGVGANYGALNGLNTGMGYGTLSNGGYGGSPGYGMGGGYGSLLNNALTGASSGYGYAMGYGMMGTQWMQNPYSGYLRGAAALTTANADYYRTIQTAKLTRQDVLRSAIQTRRAMIEEADYERAHMPDPEKIRQDQLRRELDHARISPPLTEIWSGKSLNVLMRNLIAQQGQGVRGPSVALSEDTLKSINLTAGDSRGNVGLLKEQGNLQWPQSLQAEAFKDAREDLTRRLKQAVDTVSVGNKTPDPGTINDLDADLKKLNDTLDFSVSGLSPDQYIESKRYLKLLGNTVTALKGRDVQNYFNGNWTAKGKNVAELVQFMREKGLWFAPATPIDEPAYLALYYSLASYDAATARMSGSGDNK